MHWPWRYPPITYGAAVGLTVFLHQYNSETGVLGKLARVFSRVGDQRMFKGDARDCHNHINLDYMLTLANHTGLVRVTTLLT